VQDAGFELKRCVYLHWEALFLPDEARLCGVHKGLPGENLCWGTGGCNCSTQFSRDCSSSLGEWLLDWR